MDVKEAIYTRRSIRAYENRPVERGLIQQVIEAAVQAPCGMGFEPWKFAVIQDRKILVDLSGRTKAHILGMIDQIPPLARYRETLENPNFDVFYGAPALVLICRSTQNPGPTADIDCTLAAENLMLAAPASAWARAGWVSWGRTSRRTRPRSASASRKVTGSWRRSPPAIRPSSSRPRKGTPP